jgi:cold shock CspA family protein
VSDEESGVAQGTIKEYDGAGRAGSLLMDDRSEVAIDATSLEGAGLRTLRIGQRVKFDLAEEAGRKVARSLRIVTID